MSVEWFWGSYGGFQAEALRLMRRGCGVEFEVFDIEVPGECIQTRVFYRSIEKIEINETIKKAALSLKYDYNNLVRDPDVSSDCMYLPT
jgi:hypothetical protein